MRGPTRGRVAHMPQRVLTLTGRPLFWVGVTLPAAGGPHKAWLTHSRSAERRLM